MRAQSRECIDVMHRRGPDHDACKAFSGEREARYAVRCRAPALSVPKSASRLRSTVSRRAISGFSSFMFALLTTPKDCTPTCKL